MTIHMKRAKHKQYSHVLLFLNRFFPNKKIKVIFKFCTRYRVKLFLKELRYDILSRFFCDVENFH